MIVKNVRLCDKLIRKYAFSHAHIDINDSIMAVTCDFQQCGILTSVDSDKPVQPPSKLRNSKWCSVNCLTIIAYSSD